MSVRLPRVATGVLIVSIMVLMSEQSWAIREGLGPSKDEWGLKYDVAVHDGDGDKVTVVFTLADERTDCEALSPVAPRCFRSY